MVRGAGPQPPRGRPSSRGCQSPSLGDTRVRVSLVRVPREGSDGAASLREPPGLCGATGPCPPAPSTHTAQRLFFTGAPSPLTFPLSAPGPQHRREGSPGLPLQAALPAVSPASQTRVRLFIPNAVLCFYFCEAAFSGERKQILVPQLAFCSRAGLARVALTQGWRDMPAPRTWGGLAQPWEGRCGKEAGGAGGAGRVGAERRGSEGDAREEPKRSDPAGPTEVGGTDPGRAWGQGAQQGQTARTHSMQEAQAVSQLWSGRHDARHLPAPPHFRQAHVPSNHRAGLAPLANHSLRAGPEANFGKQFVPEPILSPRTKTDKPSNQLQGPMRPGAARVEV